MILSRRQELSSELGRARSPRQRIAAGIMLASVTIPPDSTGKQVETVTASANLHRQVLVLGDAVTPANLETVGLFHQSDANAPASTYSGLVSSLEQFFNGTNWDRRYANYRQTAIASTVYATGTTNSADLTNWNAKGVAIFFDVTAITTWSSPTINLQAKAGSDYLTLYQFVVPSNAIQGAPSSQLLAFAVYPGSPSGGLWTLPPIQGPVPRSFRLQVVHAGTPTYTATTYLDELL